MAHALRRMPVTAKMNIFEREVGSYDNLFAPPRVQHCTIIADAERNDPTAYAVVGLRVFE